MTPIQCSYNSSGRFSASLVGNSQEIRQNQPRSIRVSFHASRAGDFHGSLMITFIDRARRNDRRFTVTRELHGCAMLPGGPGGISVSREEGVDFGIVERMDLDGPFATPTSSLKIKNAEGFPAVTLVQANIRILFGSNSR